MQLVEKHIITPSHPLYNECDKLCFSSKNIYNRSLYLIKTEYETSKTYNTLNDLYKYLKNEDCYKQLPTKVAQATLRSVATALKSFFQSIKSKKAGSINHDISFPFYLHKTNGRYLATFNNQTISKKVFSKNGHIKLSQCNIELNTNISDFTSIDCVRIVPQTEQYTIEVVYTYLPVLADVNTNSYAAIDLGVNNLATVTYSNGKRPIIVNGKPLKSINQYYNKRLAYYKSKLEKVNKKKSSHRTKRLGNKRTNKVDNYLHKASKYIVDSLVRDKVGVLVIGKNEEWKQNANIGKKNNQNFVQIPHSRFIDMLCYKCEKVGIEVKIQEESYTSKCSFIDMEDISKHDVYMGKRIKRGLYRSSNGRLINADVNGSYNIMRKAIPNIFKDYGIEGVVVHPVIIQL